MTKEGKYEAIYLRYGKSAYNSLLNEAKQREIEEAYGKRSLKSISHKVSYKVKSALAILGGTSSLAIAGTTIAQHEAIKNENYHKYEDVINGKMVIGEQIDISGITLFGSIGKENPWSMYRTPLDDFAYRGLDSLSLPDEYIKSFLAPSITIDELNAEYGVDAQNAALVSAKEKEENYIRTQSKQNDFKSSIKVNLDEKQNENIYSLDELQNIYDESIKNIDSIHIQ